MGRVCKWGSFIKYCNFKIIAYPNLKNIINFRKTLQAIKPKTYLYIHIADFLQQLQFGI